MPYGILTVLAIGNVHAIFGVLNVFAFGNIHGFGDVQVVLSVLARLLLCIHCTQPWHICAADHPIARYGRRRILQTTTCIFDCCVGVCLIFPCIRLLLSLLLTI